jgi:UPF0755 protein
MEPIDNFSPLSYETPVPHAGIPPVAPIPSQIPLAKKRFLLVEGAFFIAALLIMAVVAIFPPGAFPTGTTFHIEENSSLGQITDDLYSQHLIKSEALFKSFVILFSGQRGIKAGDYLFGSRESVIGVAWRLVHGEEGLVPIKVTIPEGFDVRQISDTFGKDIPGFATSTFMADAQPLEGYLFPDTYFFNQDTSPDDAVQAMQTLFDQKIAGENVSIAASGHATSSIITMASILEREATSSYDRRIVAGILWKRLDNKMPLQVDAALAYALNKDGTKLTSADLATISPFNTYKNLGLPPSPIGNPGLSAILDALSPTTTPYWYYLSDSKGNIHYAATYDEQIANEAKYL